MPGATARRAYRCVVVNIKPGNPTPIVDLDPVRVSKGRGEGHGDEVVWECDSDFQVTFNPADCPFRSHNFDKSNNRSGPPTVPPRGTPYKYTVTVGGGTLDPNTIVDP